MAARVASGIGFIGAGAIRQDATSKSGAPGAAWSGSGSWRPRAVNWFRQPFWAAELMMLAGEVDEVRRGTPRESGRPDAVIEMSFTSQETSGQDDLSRVRRTPRVARHRADVDLQRVDRVAVGA